ncbi:MAG: sigma-70 family RNA polymerase sigma factor [Chloroflexi bacterium]|nr:MAG: sigma-70 family RNA polymerase sigma factor [Chloroflexota bacterium]
MPWALAQGSKRRADRCTRQRRGFDANRSRWPSREGAAAPVLPLLHENGQHAAPVADWSPSVDDPSRQTELRMALTTAIDGLPLDYRTALILRDVEGLSNVEVAAALGITVANAKSRTHRARLFLRKRLGSFMSDATVGVAPPSHE